MYSNYSQLLVTHSFIEFKGSFNKMVTFEQLHHYIILIQTVGYIRSTVMIYRNNNQLS